MIRSLALAAVASVLLAAAPARAEVGAKDLSDLATAKVASLDLMKARLEFASDRSDNRLRLSLLRDAMDNLSDAEPDAVKALRAAASRTGAAVPADVRHALARLDAADRGVDAFLASLVTSGSPIALDAEAPAPDTPVVAGPMPVAVTVAAD